MTSTTISSSAQSGLSEYIEQQYRTMFEMKESFEDFLTNVELFTEVERLLEDPRSDPHDNVDISLTAPKQNKDAQLHHAASSISKASDGSSRTAANNARVKIPDPLQNTPTWSKAVCPTLQKDSQVIENNATSSPSPSPSSNASEMIQCHNGDPISTPSTQENANLQASLSSAIKTSFSTNKQTLKKTKSVQTPAKTLSREKEYFDDVERLQDTVERR